MGLTAPRECAPHIMFIGPGSRTKARGTHSLRDLKYYGFFLSHDSVFFLIDNNWVLFFYLLLFLYVY